MEEQIEAVQRMQNYIAEHISENISLASLSKVSCFSPWYSHRLFLKHTNMTPADYIRRLRLSKSAIRLRDESCKIIDVALELGFKSVDGYQRAFFREFRCNPGEYAKDLMFKGEPFAEEDYCQAIEEVQKAIAKYDPQVIAAQWDLSNPRIQLEPIGTRGYIELCPIIAGINQ